ncbi:MAG TPA: hypothetical protein VFE90_09140 [Myxococcales bacterium]|nr:hypothetical protein [Myxococcales bacterium]
MPTLTANERREIDRQLKTKLGTNSALLAMPQHKREEVLRHTAEIVAALAARPGRPPADVYALAGETGTASSRQPQLGEGVRTGVTEAARMVKEINFPAFVASLIEGTFHSIVKSSIEQMNAYADMVKSVAQSLNEFRDENVSQNQAKDFLVKKYPQTFQLDTSQGDPHVTMRQGAEDSELPNFQKDLGLPEAVDSLDDDTIQQTLVPAARDEVAKGRQQLLATVILMGINRIVVTDGRINAKMRFQFSASDQKTTQASDYDYQNLGDTTVEQKAGDQGTGQWKDGAGTWNYVQGDYQRVTAPNVKVTSEVHSDTTASLQASGQMMGEVAINFRSETFPLEKMVNTDQLARLNQAQAGAGRATPPPGQAPQAAAPPAAPPATAPAPAH